jgi:dihydrofolate reductase
MGKVIVGLSMSLDGFVAGPNDGPGNPLGDGGERLFRWYFSGDTEVRVPGAPVFQVAAKSAELLQEAIQASGAMVAGRRMFEIAGGWGGNPPVAPCFVLTHQPPQEWVKAGSPFLFVTDGIESAIRQAKQVAGDKNVSVSSASVAQQCIQARLLDEIYVHLVPVLLGGGVRFFDQLGVTPVDLEGIRVIETPEVTHLVFRVVK